MVERKEQDRAGRGGLSRHPLCTAAQVCATSMPMQKSIVEFLSLAPADVIQLLGNGPLLVTQDEEPRFVAQSVEAFETMVRRLRELESSNRRDSSRRARVIPIRP